MWWLFMFWLPVWSPVHKRSYRWPSWWINLCLHKEICQLKYMRYTAVEKWKKRNASITSLKPNQHSFQSRKEDCSLWSFMIFFLSINAFSIIKLNSPVKCVSIWNAVIWYHFDILMSGYIVPCAKGEPLPIPLFSSFLYNPHPVLAHFTESKISLLM